MKTELTELDKQELVKINKYNKETIDKINNGYPIQYIIGNVNFYGYEMKVTEDTLIPRFETETLVEKTIKYAKKLNKDNLKILDLCTGTGCIGITLKREIPSSEVTISDISEKALEVAKENSKTNHTDINIIKSDLFENISNKFDIIVSNPPYIPNNEVLPINVLHEPHNALFGGDKGTEIIEKILSEINNYLNDKYIVALEIHENSKKDLEILLNKHFKDIKYSFENDLTGRLRYLFIINV